MSISQDMWGPRADLDFTFRHVVTVPAQMDGMNLSGSHGYSELKYYLHSMATICADVQCGHWDANFPGSSFLSGIGAHFSEACNALFGVRGALVQIETWFQPEGRIGAQRNWSIQNGETGEIYGRSTR